MKTLGHRVAKAVLRAGRAEFFGNDYADLPPWRCPDVAQDDRVPQFGFVGKSYEKHRLLVLGINPGNGPDDHRTHGDEVLLETLNTFIAHQTPGKFRQAGRVVQKIMVDWSVWHSDFRPWMEPHQLGIDDIAFTNACPWRTASQGNMSDRVRERSLVLYLKPMLSELRPRIIVALGRMPQKLAEDTGFDKDRVLYWSRRSGPKNKHRRTTQERLKVLLDSSLKA